MLASPIAVAAPPKHVDGSAASPQHDTQDDRLVLTRVVPNDKRIIARLAAELDVIGLTAQQIDMGRDAPPLGTDLIDRVDAAGASAAIEIVIVDGRVDVWVADANTGKTLTRRFDLAIDPEQGEPRTLAIAAVELLRASRLELEAQQGAGTPTPGPTEQATDDEQAPRPVRGSAELPLRGAVSLAPVLGGSPGGFGFTAQLEVAARWAPPRRRFALRASAWVPTLGNQIMDDRGLARVLMVMGFVEPQVRLPGGAPWFHPELGLGLGAAITIIQGQAVGELRSAEAVLGGFAGHGHVGLGFEVSPRVWLRVDGYVGIIQPNPDVVFVEDVVASWGLPFGMGSLGAEIWF